MAQLARNLHPLDVRARLGAVLVSLAAATPGALAIDMAQPAIVRLCVRDAKGRPVPGAVITVNPFGGEWGGQYKEVPRSRHVPNANGLLALELRRPGGAPASVITWCPLICVKADGCVAERRLPRLFPGAEFEYEVTLQPKRTTLIKVRGPDNGPWAHARLELSYPADRETKDRRIDRVFADEKGEYVFAHAPLPGGFEVTVGEGRFSFGHTARPTARRVVGDLPEVIVSLKEDELPRPSPPRHLVGKLVGPDGGPARGWFVAQAIEHGGSSMSIPAGPRTDHYGVAGLVEVGPGGGFSIERAGERLCVISPEGIPFLHPLAPESWPKGTRRVTLHLPVLQRHHHGRIRYEDGSPARRTPIRINSVRFGWRYSVTFGRPYGWSSVPLQQAVTEDGTVIAGLATDDDGRYALPIYAGSEVDCWPLLPRWFTPSPLSTSSNVTLRPHRRGSSDQYRLVTISVRDAKGAAVTDFKIAGYRGYHRGKWTINSAGDCRDARGRHLLLNGPIDRLELEIEATGWKPLERAFDIPGMDDRTVEIVMPKSHRLLPLSGRVLDADDKPVSAARVSLFNHKPEHGTQPVHLGLTATTDDEGHFAFEAAPDECHVWVSRYGGDGRINTLPGWIEPVPVKHNEREIIIRLNRFGSVKVRLPNGFVPGYSTLSLNSRKARPDEPQGQSCSLRHDRNARAFLSRSVRPGTYDLSARLPASRYDLRGISDVVVNVRAGEEALVDLGAEGRYPPRELPKVPVTLRIMHEAEPVSGALVRAYSEERRAGIDPEAVYEVFADLSDDSGQVRLESPSGQRFLVTARVHGRLIGWRRFVVQREETVTLEMLPARTLLVHLNELQKDGKRGRYDGRWPYLRIDGLDSDENLALRRSLDLIEPPWAGLPLSPDAASKGFARIGKVGPCMFAAYDLPAGRTVALQVREYGTDPLAQRKVALPVGDRQSEIELRINAPSHQTE